MNILFITDEYLPLPSSNGVCVNKLVCAVEPEDNAYVLSVTSRPHDDLRDVFYADYTRKPASLCNRLFRFCQDDGFVKAIYRKADEIIRTKQIDKVVCVYRPVETLVAGLMLKKKYRNIDLIPYFLDNIYEINLSNRIKTAIVRLNSRRLLKRLYRRSKKMISLKYYRSTFESILSNKKKLYFVGLPSLLNQISDNVSGSKRGKIVYAGSLAEDYRNPEQVLEFLSDVFKISESPSLEMFSVGCEQQLANAKERMGERLKLNGTVPFEQVKDELQTADILLNIGNDLPYAVPGKLFEYFSTGKPIINFSFREDDPAREDFEKYPGIFTVYAYKENSAQACTEFIQNAECIKDFSVLAGLYTDSTPRYTFNLIKKSGE